MNVHWLEQTEEDVPAENDWLSANEAVYLNALRFAKRRADWRLGRWTAKCALAAALNMPAAFRSWQTLHIRPAPDGAPEAFVDDEPAAITISLSHRSGIAICAVAALGVSLGCDLELVEPRSDAFVADYFTAEEEARVTCATLADRDQLLTLLWSAKESALKALRAGLRLDTRSVIVDPLAPSFNLNSWSPLSVRYSGVAGAGGRIFHGWWQRANNIVRTVVADPPPDSPILLKIPHRLRPEPIVG